VGSGSGQAEEAYCLEPRQSRERETPGRIEKLVQELDNEKRERSDAAIRAPLIDVDVEHGAIHRGVRIRLVISVL
jgi:hypothetical protein